MRVPYVQDDLLVDAEEQRALIALSLVSGVGPGRIRSLLARFGSAEEALAASDSALDEVPGIGPQTAQAIRAFDQFDLVDDQLRRAESCLARLVTSWDSAYPRLLRHIYDPPAFLWIRGEMLPSDDRAVAVVGTRRATEYGRSVAHELSAGLASAGYTVVSGLAYGVDAAAHRGALQAGGRSFGVLGSGVDRIYPSNHSRLAKELTEHGALISEFPMGAEPDAPNFPRRNRLIAGLTLGTVVVEAFETGGALITAHLATEQNREVFAVPSPIQSKAGAGCNLLIQRGHAKLVTCVDDIIAEFGAGSPPESTPSAGPPPDDLSEIETLLLTHLGSAPVQIDSLCAAAGLDSSTALVYLLSLEFKGLVRQMAGKQFLLAQ
jgi:DNA processing protein